MRTKRIAVGLIGCGWAALLAGCLAASRQLTPPPSEGKADECQAALKIAGDQYQAYQLAKPAAPVDVAKLSLAVVADPGMRFARTAGLPYGTVPPAKEVDEATRNHMASAVLAGAKDYLATKQKVTISDQAPLRVLVVLTGRGGVLFGANEEDCGSSIDYDVMLLNTQQHQVLWYPGGMCGCGRSEQDAEAADVKGVSEALQKLFGDKDTKDAKDTKAPPK
jgi:hypothetical protein